MLMSCFHYDVTVVDESPAVVSASDPEPISAVKIASLGAAVSPVPVGMKTGNDLEFALMNVEQAFLFWEQTVVCILLPNPEERRNALHVAFCSFDKGRGSFWMEVKKHIGCECSYCDRDPGLRVIAKTIGANDSVPEALYMIVESEEKVDLVELRALLQAFGKRMDGRIHPWMFRLENWSARVLSTRGTRVDPTEPMGSTWKPCSVVQFEGTFDITDVPATPPAPVGTTMSLWGRRFTVRSVYTGDDALVQAGKYFPANFTREDFKTREGYMEWRGEVQLNDPSWLCFNPESLNIGTLNPGLLLYRRAPIYWLHRVI